MRKGVAEARGQQSIWMQLRQLVLLCQLPNPDPNDLAALAAIYAGLREGSDTVVVREARELINAERLQST